MKNFMTFELLNRLLPEFLNDTGVLDVICLSNSVRSIFMNPCHNTNKIMLVTDLF